MRPFILLECLLSLALISQVRAQTIDSITDARDGQVYTVVKIGEQWWMAENLNVGVIVHSDSGQSDNGIVEKYAYHNDSSFCDTEGGLYSWHEAMNYDTAEGGQGICPTGWHIPSDPEWKVLEMHLGMSQSQADSTGWRGTDQGTQLKTNDSLGFNPQFSGRLSSDEFVYIDTMDCYWTSTQQTASGYQGYSVVWYRSLITVAPGIYRGAAGVHQINYCIRCVADSGTDIPVKMGSFDAEQCDEGIRIVWTTVSEQENLGFNLLRSSTPDGGYEKINSRIIPGAGTTTVPQEYVYTDVNVVPGTWWYMLEQVDVGGHSDYSYPVTVQYGTASLDDGGIAHYQQNSSSRLLDLQGGSVAADGIGIRFIRDEYTLKKVLKLD